jgi:hypothetical protein
VIGRDRAGVIVVPAEVDYVSWTKRASYFRHLESSERWYKEIAKIRKECQPDDPK